MESLYLVIIDVVQNDEGVPIFQMERVLVDSIMAR